MSKETLQALRDRINARLQTSATSRDRASAAGREVVAQCRQSDVETLEWVLSEIDAVLATPEPGIALLRTPRGGGEEDGGEFCDLCGEEFDPSELGTVIGPLGEDDGVPRWYRCPRCARAYDAGYQQGQRDPRGDETADPTAPRSDAQGEDQWEDLIFGTLVEAYNEAHAARRSEGGSNGLE